MSRLWARVILAGYTTFMLVITLCILGGKHAVLNLVPFRSMIHDWRVGGQPFIINFCGNFFAFMPFGMLLPFVRSRPTRAWQALVWVGAFSLMIETCQYLFAGRTADIDDVILDALGGLAGFLVIKPFWKTHQCDSVIHDSSNVA